MDNLICNTLVVKVASRCNLNCTYCYMYNAGDSSWKKQPKVMSWQTVNMLGERIKEHCIETGINVFTVVIHGGEPLLAGEEFFRIFTQILRDKLGSEITLRLLLQTNGTLLTESWCSLFEELGIRSGISLDGLKDDNDKYRIYHSGKGSYDDIVKGLKIAQKSSLKRKPGILTVINVDADPIETYRHLQQLGANSVNFLLPDNNYLQLPPSSTVNPESETPYADWLIAIFDIWFEEDDKKRLEVGHFTQIIELLLGGSTGTEMFGTQYNGILVIETDGGIEAADTLKACGDEFTKMGASIYSHSFTDAFETPLAKMYANAHKFLSRKCASCPIVKVCGGGLIQTRYSKENGFNNPSVYCKDYLKLITYIQNRLLEVLPAEFVERNEVAKLTYTDAIKILKQRESLEISTPVYEEFISSF